MDELTQEAIMNLLIARREIAFTELENDEEYKEICQSQEEGEKVVEELYKIFDKKQRITIRRHWEGEIVKTNYEIEKAYIQGLRDCFKLMGFLKGDDLDI